MESMQTAWEKYPGLVISASLHGVALVCLLVNFVHPEPLPDAHESIPVDMISLSRFDEIMNGEKTAKLQQKPMRRVDKVAALEEHNPAPPLAEAKKDTPTEPSPDKPNNDPGHDIAKPPQPVAAAPPPPVQTPTPPQPPARPVAEVAPPKPDVPPPPAPTPPEKPVALVAPPKVDTPVPPKREDLTPPPDAEALAPKPTPRPKPPQKEVKRDVKPVVKHEAKPRPLQLHAHPVETKVATLVPEPPKPVQPPVPDPPKPSVVDQVSKLLDSLKPPKPVVKPPAGNEAEVPKPKREFNLSKISALLDHDAPQRKASTGKQLTQMASLGAPNAHAAKMSPSMTAQLDAWMIDHYRGCWSYFGLGATQDYVPAVRVKMAEDGSLIGRPSLLNPPSDPNLRSLADSAIRAVNRCNPMNMPDRFKPYYDAWRERVVRFDPKELS